MPAEEVAILADDLTGALDAAAPFARAARPVAVLWGEQAPPQAGGFAIDSETREISAPRAQAVVDRLMPHLAKRPVAMKKVDSLLRGNTVSELAACWKGGLFRSLVVAPAFPAQARVTRGGLQYARIGGDWQAVGRDLVAALRGYGLPARTLTRDADAGGAGVLVCDAESDADLAAIAGRGESLAGPVLWCGSAGLAHALAGAMAEPLRLAGRRRLVVAGTRHPVTAAQIEALAATRPDVLVALASLADVEAAAGRVGERLDRDGVAALVLRLPPLAPDEAAAVAARAFAALAALPAPDLVAVTGGETLIRLCGALAATRLDALGEWRPGIPVARFADGAFAGSMLVSKSGAFGTADVLAAIATHGTKTH